MLWFQDTVGFRTFRTFRTFRGEGGQGVLNKIVDFGVPKWHPKFYQYISVLPLVANNDDFVECKSENYEGEKSTICSIELWKGEQQEANFMFNKNF